MLVSLGGSFLEYRRFMRLCILRLFMSWAKKRKPANANIRFNIPPVMLFHQVKHNTARIIFPTAKASTIHGRYLPILIKTVSRSMTLSSFAVLGTALEDDASFSGIWVFLLYNKYFNYEQR